jgi:glutaredoxin
LEGGYVANQLLEGGFKTIKDIGNDANYATADIIKAIKKGWIQVPDIIYAGKNYCTLWRPDQWGKFRK